MTRQKIITVLRVGIAVVTLAAVVYAVVRNWADMSVHLDKISWATFAWSTLAAAVGTWLTMIGWKTLLADLGSDLHLAPASGVYFVGQLGKYLPGSLWSVLVQADMASALKVPRRRTAVTGLLALGLALATGFLVGLPAASYLLTRTSTGFDWWLLLGIPILVVLCVPRLLNALIARMLKSLRRDPLEHDGSFAAVASQGGAPTHPQWYRNLLAHPDIELQVGTETFPVHARELEGEERSQWWERCVAAFPSYREYQTKTDRLIPVFVLERR